LGKHQAQREQPDLLREDDEAVAGEEFKVSWQRPF